MSTKRPVCSSAYRLGWPPRLLVLMSSARRARSVEFPVSKEFARLRACVDKVSRLKPAWRAWSMSNRIQSRDAGECPVETASLTPAELAACDARRALVSRQSTTGFGMVLEKMA